jgi:hypothetical protein
MSAADQGPAGSSLTREQVLDELEFLAKVEHALVIECLSVCYALGYDLGPDEGGLDRLNELQPIVVDHGTGHAAAFAAITDPLAGLAPGDYLRVTRRLAADSFEERLLAASDRGYRLKSWLRGVSDRRAAPSV